MLYIHEELWALRYNIGTPVPMQRRSGARLPYPDDISGIPKGVRSRGVLPASVDLRDRLLPIRDQGETSMCVCFASCCMMERVGNIHEYLSPEFIYRHRADRLVDGMTVVDAMRVLVRCGVCRESVVDTPAEYRDGAERLLGGFADVRDLPALKSALAAGKLCVVSLPFYDRDDDKFWIPSGERIGGHAVCIVGYNDDTCVLTFRNSWGVDWCDGGYGYITYGEFTRSVWEAYSVDGGKPSPTPTPTLTPTCKCTVV